MPLSSVKFTNKNRTESIWDRYHGATFCVITFSSICLIKNRVFFELKTAVVTLLFSLLNQTAISERLVLDQKADTSDHIEKKKKKVKKGHTKPFLFVRLQ